MNRLWLAWVGVFLLTLAACSGPEPTMAVDGTRAAGVTPVLPTDLPSATPELPPMAVVREVINQVQAHEMEGEDWSDALVDMQIHPGGEVWAQEGSTSLVELDNDLIRVAPNTVFTLKKPDAQTRQLNLQEGQVWLNVEGLQEGEKFEITTPTLAASVRGTRFTVRVDQDGATMVAVKEGLVSVAVPTGTVEVQTKGSVLVSPSGAVSQQDTMGTAEYIGWNMAAGENLEIAMPVGGLETVYTLQGGFITDGAWSYDGANYLFEAQIYSPDNVVTSQNYVYNLGSGEASPLEVPGNTLVIKPSPAENRLAYIEQNPDSTRRVCWMSYDGSDWKCGENSDTYYTFTNLYWAPDGKQLLVDLRGNNLGDSHDVSTLDLQDSGTPAPVELTYFLPQIIVDFCWSPDGQYLAMITGSREDSQAPQQLWLANADGSEKRQVLDNVVDFYGELSEVWSPDSQWLLVYTTDKGLVRVTAQGDILDLVPTLATAGNPLDFSYVSLAPTASGFPIYYSFLEDTPGDGPKNYRSLFLPDSGSQPGEYSSTGSRPNFSPDGTHVAFVVNMMKENGERQGSIYFFRLDPLWP